MMIKLELLASTAISSIRSSIMITGLAAGIDYDIAELVMGR